VIDEIKFEGFGSLFLCSPSSVDEVKKIKDPLRLCITRGQAPKVMAKWAHHSHDSKGRPNRLIEAMSPSWNILNKYKASRRDKMAEKEYVYGWHLEKDENHTYKRAISSVCDLLEKGRNVVLGCFCECLFCHRFLVAEDIKTEMARRSSK
jgi:hypothetical protein